MPAELSNFLGWFAAHEGRPYLWGGRGPKMWTPTGIKDSPYEGFDCWGAVACALLESGGPDWRWHHNTDVAWTLLPPVATPEPGDLAFWAPKHPKAPNDVEHVEVVSGPGPELGAWRTIGAAGGGSRVLTLADAERANARIRYRPAHYHRLYFAGWRRLPLEGR